MEHVPEPMFILRVKVADWILSNGNLLMEITMSAHPLMEMDPASAYESGTSMSPSKSVMVSSVDHEPSYCESLNGWMREIEIGPTPDPIGPRSSGVGNNRI